MLGIEGKLDRLSTRHALKSSTQQSSDMTPHHASHAGLQAGRPLPTQSSCKPVCCCMTCAHRPGHALTLCLAMVSINPEVIPA